MPPLSPRRFSFSYADAAITAFIDAFAAIEDAASYCLRQIDYFR